MKLKLTTRVEQPPQQVWAGFNEQLFKELAPPFPKIKLLRFDGSTTGDIVEVELNLVLFKQIWQSLIVDHGQDGSSVWFVDEGKRLPFFLRSWRHHHLIEADGSGSTITDDIEFRSPNLLLDYLLLPSLWLQFAYRKPVYRRVFKLRA